MRFDKEKKESIKAYILSKISDNAVNIYEYVSAALEINKSTVYRYVNEMVAEGLITKKTDGSFSVASDNVTLVLSRSKDELSDETIITNKFIAGYYRILPENVSRICLDMSAHHHLKASIQVL